MRHLVTAGLAVLLLLGCGAREPDGDPVLDRVTEGGRYVVLGEETADYLGTGPARLILLNDTRRHYGNDFDPYSLHRAVVHDPHTDSFVETGFWTLYYGTVIPADDYIIRYEQQAMQLEGTLGAWNGYCYTYDLNGNGRQEIIAFRLAGDSFYPVIFEYHDGEFRETLGYEGEYHPGFAAVDVPGPGRITVYGYGERVLGPHPWRLYEWDGTSLAYRVVKTGVVEVLPE